MMVSFVILLLACTARIAWQTDRQTDRQNDKPSTVTLAAHARRGLIRAKFRGLLNLIVTKFSSYILKQKASGHHLGM